MTFLFHTLGAWWLYILVMWMKRKEQEIKVKGGLWLVLAYTILVIALVADVAYNLVYGTLLQMGIGTLLFTSTLQRIRQNPKAFYQWQRDIADTICEKMLNPHNPQHC